MTVEEFQFATATRIVFGWDALLRLPSLLGTLRSGVSCRRWLVVTGSDSSRAEPLLALLHEAGLEYHSVSIKGEPSVEAVQQALEVAERAKVEGVVGFGGGSAIDAGKAIATLLVNPGGALDYLEIIGRGRALQRRGAPYVAIPTTAGTGAEVTKNAVLVSDEHRVKVSLRSDWMLPDLALVDPRLTVSMPAAVTASTGMDALTQVLEPYVSCQHNPLTDALCVQGLTRAARSLLRAYRDGQDREAREDMALASLLGGLALANAKLGAVHGFAGPLGGMFDAPHGAICARLCPLVMQANVMALRQRDPEHVALKRYDTVAQILTGRASARAEEGVAWLTDLGRQLSIPSLASYGMTSGDIPSAIEKAARASSMKGNPVVLSSQELGQIMQRAMS